ncbi:hypothetical protein GCM10007921_12350 [Tritonibacter mobilis]|nr:hypothetical protein GCM10007921_12350 [Tritonibacter mobilis]SDX86200.1 hypothetical protein SAMN05444385_11557 [Tritonibacter mobilis]
MIGPIICIAGVLICAVGAVHCCLAYQDAVRNVRVDPERVRRFVDSAPLHRLEEMKAKRLVCQCCGAPLEARGV